MPARMVGTAGSRCEPPWSPWAAIPSGQEHFPGATHTAPGPPVTIHPADSGSPPADPAVSRHRLGTQLRQLRQARALRLADVAAELGIAGSTLSRIETGKAGSAPPATPSQCPGR